MISPCLHLPLIGVQQALMKKGFASHSGQQRSDFLMAGLSIGLIKIEDSSDLDMLDTLVIRLDASSTFIFVPLNCLVP